MIDKMYGRDYTCKSTQDHSPDVYLGDGIHQPTSEQCCSYSPHELHSKHAACSPSSPATAHTELWDLPYHTSTAPILTKSITSVQPS